MITKSDVRVYGCKTYNQFYKHYASMIINSDPDAQLILNMFGLEQFEEFRILTLETFKDDEDTLKEIAYFLFKNRNFTS